MKKYSNKYLFISVHGLKVRTYLDSIASNIIDFTAISLKPKEEKIFNVYWAFKQKVTLRNMKIKLIWIQ